MRRVFSIVLACMAVLFSGCVSREADSKRDGSYDKIAYMKDIEDAIAALRIPGAGQIARFDLQLNYTTNSQYSAFEVKATTNNFANIGEYKRLIYYAQSEAADQGKTIETAQNEWRENPAHSGQEPQNDEDKNGSLDKMWLFVCSNHGDGDSRQYKYIGRTGVFSSDGSWNHQITDIVVLIAGGNNQFNCLQRHPNNPSSLRNDWLSEDNQELIWMWLRAAYSAGQIYHEKEAGSDRPMWRVVTPSCWYTTMPSWAVEAIREHSN